MLAVAAVAVAAAILIIALDGHGDSGSRHGGGATRDGRGTVVQLAAGYLGVPVAEVRARLRRGETLGQIAASGKGASRIGLIESLYSARAAAVKARGLSPAAEAAELRTVRRTLIAQVDHARRRAGLVRGAASYLGLDEAELTGKLAGGHTLAQVAAATPGRSWAGLLQALLATRRQAIERAVSEKAVSAGAAHRALSRLRSRLERQIERPGG
ncbi:MAG TPA: hypothetical protein VN618_14405 [Solirubrobacteraceae bacterium]|nr:hypothetical protein [Solirubrobacteraceae bacterium]